MKDVRTRLGFEAVTLGEGDDAVTLSREPITVSNALAEQYEKAAAKVGVRLRITDAEGDDPESTVDPSSTAAVDLSAGVAAVTGRGEPVTSEVANGGESDTSKAGDKPSTGRPGGTTGRN